MIANNNDRRCKWEIGREEEKENGEWMVKKGNDFESPKIRLR